MTCKLVKANQIGRNFVGYRTLLSRDLRHCCAPAKGNLRIERRKLRNPHLEAMHLGSIYECNSH